MDKVGLCDVMNTVDAISEKAKQNRNISEVLMILVLQKLKYDAWRRFLDIVDRHCNGARCFTYLED